jgi:hypothetical protein
MAKVQTEVNEATFTKQQLIASKKYAEKKDLLNALLVDGKSYSLIEVEETIDGFLKGKVI